MNAEGGVLQAPGIPLEGKEAFVFLRFHENLLIHIGVSLEGSMVPSVSTEHAVNWGVP